MMRPRLIAVVAVLGGCDTFSTGELPAPEFLDTEASCSDGEMTYTALLRSSLDVSNLVLTRSDVEDEALDPVFPLVTAETWGGEVTEWTATLPHDCDTSIAVTWTATTLVETQATAETAWPDVDLSDGQVDPPFGSTLGGSVIEIQGTDMQEVDRVWFDEEPATIVSQTETSVTVQSPPHGEGVVDIRIAAGVTELELPESFTYWPDQSGWVTGAGLFGNDLYNTNWFTIGSAFISTSTFNYGSFSQHQVVLHEPLDPAESMGAQLYAPVGSCTPGSFTWTRNYVAPYISLHEDSLGELPMLRTDDEEPLYYYVEELIDAEDWTGITFDLEIPEDSEHMPAMVLEDIVSIPEDPPTKSWDIDILNDAVRYDDLTLSWVTGLADTINYSVYPVYHDWRGIQVLGVLSCTDDGSTGLVTIPWDDIMAGLDPAVPTGMMVRIGMMVQDESVMPHDNSIFQSVAINNYWVYYDFID